MPDNFVKHLVLPRMSTEDTTLLTYLSEDLNIITKTYLIDTNKRKTAPGTLTVPVNKVNPAAVHVLIPGKVTKSYKSRMVQAYLTYIIEHYDNLPNIAIFTHAHSTASHNNDLQLLPTPVMLLELNYRRIKGQGYMNLRCHWIPGCPGWIKPNATEFDDFKKEEFVMQESFKELFPQEAAHDGVPDMIGTSFCAQFAVTHSQITQH